MPTNEAPVTTIYAKSGEDKAVLPMRWTVDGAIILIPKSKLQMVGEGEQYYVFEDTHK